LLTRCRRQVFVQCQAYALPLLFCFFHFGFVSLVVRGVRFIQLWESVCRPRARHYPERPRHRPYFCPGPYRLGRQLLVWKYMGKKTCTSALYSEGPTCSYVRILGLLNRCNLSSLYFCERTHSPPIPRSTRVADLL